jgi:predicted transcriptional regulator
MITPMNHDVWQPGALAPSGREVYEALLKASDALSGRTIARQTGRSRSTVSKALKRLESVGLVYRQGTLWAAEAVDLLRLDEIAEKLGTFGRLERRKIEHKRERAWFAASQIFARSNRHT